MRKWFVVPTIEDEYRSFSVRVLHYTLLLLMTVAIIFIPFATSIVQLSFIPVVLAVFGTCYFLLHTNRYRLASGLFLGGLWLVITIASFSLNGIRNSSFSTYALIIIFAAILFSDRAVIFFTVISMLSGIVLVVGETLGVLPFRTTPLFLADRLFQQMALFGAAGILLSLASRVIRSSFLRIRLDEQTLLERNRELESEITGRERIEASLRASEEKYRVLFEATSVMAGVYDRDGTIILINDAAARLFGTTPDILQGKTLYDLFSGEDAARALRRQARVIDTGVSESIESKTTLANGKEIYFLRQISPIPAPADTPGITSQVLVITTDLTEQKLAEQRQRELQLARDKNAFFTEFLSTISHDLKTPLTVMNTSLYLLERTEDPAYRQQKMTQMKEQVELLDKYIQDMLMISRLEHLPILNKTSLEINPLIEEVLALLRPQSEKKNIECQFTPQLALPPALGEREPLRRALVNLLENAINYTPPSGQVRISAQAQNGHVLLEVKDTGIGISAEDVPHIFERFYRAAEARASVGSGTGLGLAIVKKVVDMHSGSIEVKSQLGQGTSFRILLPVLKSG